jgi:hypothetical protein
LCEEPGCDKPIFQATFQLCPIHRVQQQFKNAAAKKAVSSLNANPGPKSKGIQKSSLYKFKLDDELRQSLKRKRSAPAKTTVSDKVYSELDDLNMKSRLPKPLQQRPCSAASDMLSKGPIEEYFDISMGSKSTGESPISLSNAERDYIT